jgi:predicted transcriptional regulator
MANKSHKVPKSNVELLLRAYQHTRRQAILNHLESNGKSHVDTIWRSLGLEQSVVSQDLADLRKVGLVGYEQNGKFHGYVVVKEKIAEVRDLVAK